jgi:negative regulator of flagellin synthesis FlgM
MSYSNDIGNLQQTLSSIASTSTKPAQDVASSATNSTSTQTSVKEDQANLSTTGGLMAEALKGSDARSARVSMLQQAIASGSYGVSSSDVAEKMIDSLLQ